MSYLFYTYNLCFDSVFEPPGGQCDCRGEATPDVVITSGEVTARLKNAAVVNDFFQVATCEFLLTIPNVARYHVRNGKEIIVAPYPDADQDKVRLFLFGSAMGALLYQRGLFPLHGSAIVTEYGTKIFVGPQGIGKSTLAAHFQRRGYSLLSDDVCAITSYSDGLLQVLPAFSQLRLCTDAFERLGNREWDSTSARFDVDKYVVSLAQPDRREAFPLHAIYQLANHDAPDIIHKPLRGFDRLNVLITNLYRSMYLPGFKTKGHIMQLASAIAQRTEIYEINRPRDSGRIEELIDTLEHTWCDNNTTIERKDTASTSSLCKQRVTCL